MNFGTDKPIAAVRLEGTLRDAASGDPIPGSLDLLKILQESHYVVIVSPLAHTDGGLRVAYDWLNSYGAAFDELWASPGIPEVAVWYDNEAVTL